MPNLKNITKPLIVGLMKDADSLIGNSPQPFEFSTSE